MLLLALDTSTRQASVALCSEKRFYGEHTWQAGTNHSVEMLEHVQRLLAEGGLALSSLEGLAVALGPGSFNGVRVAVATAKTLAFALGKPLVGISTLEISAAQHQLWPGVVCSLLEAGRGEVYAGCYLFEAQKDAQSLAYSPRLLSDYQLLSPETLADFMQGEIASLCSQAGLAGTTPYLFCGEISEATRQALSTHLAQQAAFAPLSSAVRRASTLAYLAWQRIAAQHLDDPLTLEPFYLRRPNITTSTRKGPLLGQQPVSTEQQHDQLSTEREEGALRY
jgi:tRNA threonylcarbamoyladenosine biosynthesis protein TsaB